jgi:hypothetical protein
MKVNCLSCGHNIELDEAYGDGYEGEIKCFGCEARLEIRTEQNALRSVRLLGQSNDGHNRAMRNYKDGGEGARRTAARHAAQAGPAGKGAGSAHPEPAHSRSI